MPCSKNCLDDGSACLLVQFSLDKTGEPNSKIKGVHPSLQKTRRRFTCVDNARGRFPLGEYALRWKEVVE